VNIRAGQDSGFFFLQSTVDAFTYAGDIGIDVVNMSFFTDPWLFNCANNPADSPDEQLEQRTVVAATQRAANYARKHGVTLVAALGNENIDLGAPTNIDTTSPDFPLGTARSRTVDNNSCLVMPTEANGVIGVTSLGPSTRRAFYSTYGVEQADVSAPGGDSLDPAITSPGNRVLSTYPESVLRAAGEIDANGNPTIDRVIRDCHSGVCAYYRYLQGTSMASPHAAGVAALIVSEFGKKDKAHGGLTLAPSVVERILKRTATNHACPDPRLDDFGAFCAGGKDFNGFYGEGIVDALHAVEGGN
jgi:subtilisin family serine protease